MSESSALHLVPGVMRCAKCAFRLVRTNLHVYSGGMSAGDNKTEPCPNGCGPLWPETWEQRAREAERLVEGLMTNGPDQRSAALAAYARAMQAAGVPHEQLQVYDSNSHRRVGLARHYEERLYPYVMRDGQPDIRGTDLLRAMVAAFNAMLEVRARTKP